MKAPRCPVHHVPLVSRGGPYRPYWMCPSEGCDVGVTAHRDGRPMGVPTDKATRQARRRAHAAFDQLWERADENSGAWAQPEPQRSRALREVRRAARDRAYRWLATALGRTGEEVHIGNMDQETCERVVQLVNQRVAATPLP